MRTFLFSLFCVSQRGIVLVCARLSPSRLLLAKWLCYGNWLAPSREEGYFVFLLSPCLTLKSFISKSSFPQNSSSQVRSQHLSEGVHYISPSKVISNCVSCSVVPNSLRPHGLQLTRLLCPWDFPGQGYWSGLPFPSPGDLSHPGIELGSPALKENSLLTELQGKPK